MTQQPRAALLDVDGTLVDSTYAHVSAWGRALQDNGIVVQRSRIHRAIGLGTEDLLAELLGEDRAGEIRDAVSGRHDELFLADADHLEPLEGARELVAQLVRSGWRVVLASSAKPEELAALLDVLALDVDVTAATSSGDVDAAKPAPDLLEVALRKAGCGPARAAMVGDAEWDMRAAVRAKVRGVGVLTGGISEAELRAAGAAAVYAGPAAILRDLPELARLIDDDASG